MADQSNDNPIAQSQNSTKDLHSTQAKSPLQYRLVNGCNGDAAVYCFFYQSGEAILFDLGDLSNLSNRDLLKVTHVFVSHCHIDHFIGFDRLLRVNIANGCNLKVYGPPGMIKRVFGKLSGYTWNLLEPGQMTFEVHELDESGALQSAQLVNDHGFQPQTIAPPEFDSGINLPQYPARRIAELQNGTCIDAVVVDHRTPVVAYSAQSARSFQVNAFAIEAMGIRPGPWVSELQTHAAHGKWDLEIDVQGKMIRVSELAKNLLSERSSKVAGYITDIIFSEYNMMRLHLIMKDCDLLFCESCFAEEHLDRALSKKHLTTRQAALIAAQNNIKQLISFHYSNIYSNDFSRMDSEIRRFFEEYQKLEKTMLQQVVIDELGHCARTIKENHG